MSKKLYGFISAIIGGVTLIAEGAVAFFQPPAWGAIFAAIGIVSKAADEVLLLFVKKEG
jgi:hypothetical protein